MFNVTLGIKNWPICYNNCCYGITHHSKAQLQYPNLKIQHLRIPKVLSLYLTFWTTACGMVLWIQARQSVSPLVTNALFSELAHQFFLIFCMKLGVHKGSKVTEPDFSGKIWFGLFLGKKPKNGLKIVFQVFLKIGSQVFSDTVHERSQGTIKAQN